MSFKSKKSTNKSKNTKYEELLSENFELKRTNEQLRKTINDLCEYNEDLIELNSLLTHNAISLVSKNNKLSERYAKLKSKLKSKHHTKKNIESDPIMCNPSLCNYCIHISGGDFGCTKYQLEDGTYPITIDNYIPTEHYNRCNK